MCAAHLLHKPVLSSSFLKLKQGQLCWQAWKEKKLKGYVRQQVAEMMPRVWNLISLHYRAIWLY